ncbi:MAG: response regulator [Chloroflexi bacterium]|nr:response regulator [Chloroflexota bacterium]
MSEIKILLCDDDPDLLGLLVRRLKKMGIEPDSAGDGRVAKSLVDENTYDVIVTDIYMPEATGLEVMQYAKQKDEETQVVIITSSATLDNAIDSLNHGAFGYLTKPFDHLIVFDNMVSRALEYRILLVADKRKAEAQKRRGDMLEDEVAQRVRQLQKTQKGLLDLLGSLPDGILVVEQGGKIVLSSPIGERWLARDQKSENRPLQAFVNQVHAEMPEPSADVTIDGVDLHLMSADFRYDGEIKRKAIIIREVEEGAAGAGILVTEAVMGIKKGLATLYEQGLGTEVVLNVASQFAVLEQLQGWSGGTGKLIDEKAPNAIAASAAPAEAPVEPEQPVPAPTQAPAQPVPAPPAAPIQSPPPSSPDTVGASAQAAAEPAQAKSGPEQPPAARVQAPVSAGDAEGVTSLPPFAIPRERTPTGELDGPRLNTSELQEALRAAAQPDAPQVAAEPPTENSTPSGIVAEPIERQAPQTPIVDPAVETLISGSTREPETSQEVAAPAEKAAPVEPPPAREPRPPVEAVASPKDADPIKAATPESAEPPAPAAAPVGQAAPAVPVDDAPRAAPVQAPLPAAPVGAPPPAGPIEDAANAAPVQAPTSAMPVEAAPQPVPAEAPAPSPPPEVETSLEPGTPPAELPAPIPEDETPAPAWEEPGISGTDGDPTPEPEAFPRMESGTGEVPSWIDGIGGITDPDLLSDFEFEPEQPEASFPEAKTGELLDDDSMFNARVIPEEMNAKLKTPVELPSANGNQEPAPPRHDGPITIQAAQADTQIFRKVLAGLSGAEVLSGDYERPEEELPESNGGTASKPEAGLNELRAEFSEAPASDPPNEPIDTLPAEVAGASAEELRQAREPDSEPEPVHASPANWPPVLPTEGEDWDEELDVTG